MKVKVIIGLIVALMIVAQLVFGGRKKEDAPPQPSTQTANQSQARIPGMQTPPSPHDVATIVLGSEADGVKLVRSAEGWNVASLQDCPADGDKVQRLLDSLLNSRAEPLPRDREGLVTGLENGSGLPITFTLKNGRQYAPAIGLRPEGSYDRVYARLPGGAEVLLSGDIRGSLGLWKNSADDKPNPADWLDKRILRFYPTEVAALSVAYPDHKLEFAVDDNGALQPEGYIPGGDWEREGLNAWIRDLSEFEVSGLAESQEPPNSEEGRLHKLHVTTKNGEQTTGKGLTVYPNHAGGEGMLVVLDELPGRVYHLPEWRFRKYFRRLPQLFPKAVPNFELSDIRFLDVRHGGETFKFIRRDGQWSAVASHYPVKPTQLDRVARFLAGWHPEDYATPDFKKIRPGYGGPMVEVILAGGDVHQYRLAGRHPLFPWRYVSLDGKSVLSVTDAEAGVMFPEFVDVLDLGHVFEGMKLDNVAEMELNGGEGEALFLLRRHGDDEWRVEKDGHDISVDAVTAWHLVNEVLGWRVAGFYDTENRTTKNPAYSLHLTDNDGKRKSIALMLEQERDVPYVADNGRSYLMERAEFFNWLGEARVMMGKVDSEAAATAAEEQAREEAAKLPMTVENSATDKEITPEQPAPTPPAEEDPEPTATVEEHEGGDAELIHEPLGESDVAPEGDARVDAARSDAPLQDFVEQIAGPQDVPEDEYALPKRPAPRDYVGKVRGMLE